MQIIGYARVSNREQSYGSALEQQKERLVQHGVDKILSDVESGRKDQRLQFNELIELIAAGGVKKVVATRCDRISRSIITLKKFFEHCEKHQVQVLVLDDAIDTTTAAGKFHLNMLGALAEMESDRLSERVKHGHEYHQKQQKPYFAPFGYRKVENRLELDRTPILCCDGREWSPAELARYRIDLILELGSLRKALRKYNETFGIQIYSRGKGQRKKDASVGASGLSIWLSNPILRGHIAYGRTRKARVKYEDHWTIIRDTHEALITEAEWQILRDILIRNSKRMGNRGGGSKHHFLGIVRCEVCNRHCLISSSRRRTGVYTYRYQCSTYAELRACEQVQGVRAERVKEAVIAELIKRAGDIVKLESGQKAKEENPEIPILRKQVEDLLQIQPQSRVIREAIEETKREITRLEINQIIKHEETLSRQGEVLEIFSDPSFWAWLEERLSSGEIRALYRKWVKTILIRDGAVVKVELTM